jgi:DNA-binding NarL/FixJ family response regulator
MTTPRDMEGLPEVLRTVAEEISLPVALRLAAELGGTRIWVPERPRPDSALAQAMGQETAERICAVLGPGKITIPLGPNATHAHRAQRIVELLEEGLSHNEVARAVGVHVRTVERHASRAGSGDRRQSSLFDMAG